jgi:hypothetical protein
VSVLLGKVSGFEGQMMVVKPPHPDRLRVLDGPNMSLRVLHACTASVSSCSHDGDKDDVISSMKEITGVELDCLEAVADLRPRDLECLNAPVGSGLDGVGWVNPLDRWIKVSTMRPTDRTAPSRHRCGERSPRSPATSPVKYPAGPQSTAILMKSCPLKALAQESA